MELGKLGKNRSCYSWVSMWLYNNLGRVPPNFTTFLFFCGFFGVCYCWFNFLSLSLFFFWLKLKKIVSAYLYNFLQQILIIFHFLKANVAYFGNDIQIYNWVLPQFVIPSGLSLKHLTPVQCVLEEQWRPSTSVFKTGRGVGILSFAILVNDYLICHLQWVSY